MVSISKFIYCITLIEFGNYKQRSIEAIFSSTSSYITNIWKIYKR